MKKSYVKNIRPSNLHAKEKNKSSLKKKLKLLVTKGNEENNNTDSQLLNNTRLCIIPEKNKKHKFIKNGRKFNINSVPSLNDLENIKNDILMKFR